MREADPVCALGNRREAEVEVEHGDPRPLVVAKRPAFEDDGTVGDLRRSRHFERALGSPLELRVCDANGRTSGTVEHDGDVAQFEVACRVALDEVEDAMDRREDCRRDEVGIEKPIGIAQSRQRSRPAPIGQLVGDEPRVAQPGIGELQAAFEQRQKTDAETQKADIDETVAGLRAGKACARDLQRQEPVRVDPQSHRTDRRDDVAAGKVGQHRLSFLAQPIAAETGHDRTGDKCDEEKKNAQPERRAPQEASRKRTTATGPTTRLCTAQECTSIRRRLWPIGLVGQAAFRR